ncbi:MAG: YegS/Rv2252/BmrU family lipid kinase, partial [Candidatus Zixiibacteriota bacterium]
KRQIERILRVKFPEEHLSIERTMGPGHATEIARRAVREAFDTIVVVGGDGTINEVVNGVIGTNVRIGIIPSGTANDLARHFRIPRKVDRACDVILAGNIRPTDAIAVNGRYYITDGGIGLPRQSLSIAESIKRLGAVGRFLTLILGSKLYLLGLAAALPAYYKRSLPLRIRLPNKLLCIDAISLILGNQPILGKRFRVLPGAENNDGLMDIVIIEKNRSLRELLRTAAATLNGSHVERTGVKMLRGENIRIEMPRPCSFFGDGEIMQKASAFDVHVRYRAVNFLVPPGEVS